MNRILIFDGYVDEPTCLGVPPYISPYPRYIAGALRAADRTSTIHYLTIDQIRTNPGLPQLKKAQLIIVIAGMMVPGRYLSGFPISPQETFRILQPLEQPTKILCGPAARHGFGISGGKYALSPQRLANLFDLIITGDPEVVINNVATNHYSIDAVDETQQRTNPTSITAWSQQGASIVTQHPFYPQYLIAEIETYRGCSRSITGGCSFCIEPTKGPPQHRPIQDVINEIKALYNQGIRHFRLGNQPCLFSYHARDSDCREFPQPNPAAIEQLYKGIRDVAPDLLTLHMDNANPGTIAHFPKESTQIIKTIIRYHTPGDVAAFGMETADPQVLQKNNLKATNEDVRKAITLFQEYGAQQGVNGLPELLPGLNFVFGLKGETKETFRLNYIFLQSLIEQKLLVRRINLRQVIPFPGTPMEEIGTKLVKKHKHLFHQLKQQVQQNIERPLLQRLVPSTTLLTNIFTEKHDGKTTFGRQLGSYPLLVGIPGVFPLHTFLNVKIVDHGYRSLTGIPYPLDINNCQRETMEAIPGIGKKRATRMLLHRPFTNTQQLISILDDQRLYSQIQPFITLE